jgi:A/G-specific adenine glycosylase
MLQQTRVTAALPYYERFVRELPDIPALAACDPERLHKLWEGLGYYSRVRNLQKAAQQVCAQYGGRLPADYDALRALPGIGEYTAGAIGSIGFGLAVPAVDGNVLRVFARLYNDAAPIDTPAAKRQFTARVMEHQPPEAPGDYNQALMELGALVCLPGGAPQCDACPLAAQCEARRAGPDRVLALPVKHAPKARRVVPVAVALVRSPDGWLVQRRPEKGLLAGLWQPVLWENERFESEAAARAALEALGLDLDAGKAEALPPAKHIFSHIEWHMSGWQLNVPRQSAPAGCVWATPTQLREEYALPGAFKAYKGRMLQ